MNQVIQGLLSVAGRVALATIFLAASIGNDIPNFNQVVEHAMKPKGLPAPQVLLAGAIAFLIVGGLSVIVGYKARFGALLLFAFLVLATYYFHDFWNLEDAKAIQEQMIQFMKNLSMMGAMLFIMANGAGAWSFDAKRACRAQPAAT
ncbi:MAG TPA: DoxX family protein [Pirellulales bacterium]|nr:DoxX family protein [Pirellulales bacterium]